MLIPKKLATRHIPTPPMPLLNAIVAGDPDRILSFSKHLDSILFSERRREFQLVVGFKNSIPFALCSHGVGSAGALICFHELLQLGVKKIIRIGTCGALQEGLPTACVLLATKCLGLDGPTTLLYSNERALQYANLELNQKLEKAFETTTLNHRLGTIVTSDLYYDNHPQYSLQRMSDEGYLGIDMETATLFGFAESHKIQAASLLVVDGNPLKWNEGNYHASAEVVKEALSNCLNIALGEAFA